MTFDKKAGEVAVQIAERILSVAPLASELKPMRSAISTALKEAVEEAEKPLIDQLNKAFQRIQVLEEIKFNLEKAVKSKPIPWAHKENS